MDPEIEIVRGPSKGTRLGIIDTFVIGSRSDCDLRLAHANVSPLHARLTRRGDHEVFLVDLGSRSGTRVDGQPTEGEVPLHHGATISIGPFVLRLTFPENEDEDEEPALEPTPLARPARSPSTRAKATRPSSSVHAEVVASGAKEALAVVPSHSTFRVAPVAQNSREEIVKAMRHLEVLLRTNSLISTELDVDRLFDRLLGAIFEVIPAHRGAVMTIEPDGQLVTRATAVKHERAKGELRVSHTIAQRAIEERVGILSVDAPSDQRFGALESIMELEIRSVICAPMQHADEVLGLIYLDTVGIAQPFTPGDLELLTAIAGPAGGAVRNAFLVSKLKETAIDTIFRLAVAAEYRDDETGFHIHRISDYAEAVARKLGLPPAKCEQIKLASPLHDIGKIGIPDAILNKPGKLTPEELVIMREHAAKGGAILAHSPSDLLQVAEQIALTHHEKFDGSGYPRGLARDRIPIEGRIVALADVFDALLSKRCYKPPWTIEAAMDFIKKNTGTHFDPTVSEAFFADEERILGIRAHYASLETPAPEPEVPTEDIPKRTKDA